MPVSHRYAAACHECETKSISHGRNNKTPRQIVNEIIAIDTSLQEVENLSPGSVLLLRGRRNAVNMLQEFFGSRMKQEKEEEICCIFIASLFDWDSRGFCCVFSNNREAWISHTTALNAFFLPSGGSQCKTDWLADCLPNFQRRKKNLGNFSFYYPVWHKPLRRRTKTRSAGYDWAFAHVNSFLRPLRNFQNASNADKHLQQLIIVVIPPCRNSKIV